MYKPNTESDPMGLDPGRAVVHTSLYESLRTNLPREVMGFRVYPFVASTREVRDPRMYPGHGEVLEYLEDFAAEFKLNELIAFGAEVRQVEMESGKWKVRWRINGEDEELEEEVYDAVVVCNGHYTEPHVAEIPGIEKWPGKQIHSHNYRVPEPFKGQVVVLIGSSSSAADISREIAEVAKEVHIASRSVNDNATGQVQGTANLWIHPMIERIHEDGMVDFQDGTATRADIILHCTGYKYHFPFLDTNGMVTVDDNRVGPLYKHVFPPLLAPRLSFVGLPWKVVPFPLFEFQTKWIAGVLSGRITLPSSSEMMSNVESFYKAMEVSGIPKRYTHNMADYQFEYDDWLANECGALLSEEWRKKMYYISSKAKKERPDTYRDEWHDQDSLLQAYEDFTKYNTNQGKTGFVA